MVSAFVALEQHRDRQGTAVECFVVKSARGRSARVLVMLHVALSPPCPYLAGHLDDLPPLSGLPCRGTAAALLLQDFDRAHAGICNLFTFLCQRALK
jgi:hypothetical protein